MSGYFYLQRGLFEHPLFQSKAAFSERESWIWLIEKTNFEDGIYRFKSSVFSLKRGQYAGSYRSLAKSFNWSTDRVIRVIKLWFNQQMVELDTRHGFVLITLCNYEKYQVKKNDDATPTRQRRDADATPTSTNQRKERKESKESNPLIPLPDWMPIDLFLAFVEMRKGIKSPMTAKAEELAIKKLDQLRARGHDPTAVLEQSIRNGWKDLYEIKGDKNGKHGKHNNFSRQDYAANTEGFNVK
jgi:hypothetical protein